jgi:hypothetical protein
VLDEKQTEGRLFRAIHLVNSARAEGVLPYRIAAFFTALECILTRDAGEIAHTVAERVAVLSQISPKERIALYTMIKKYYNIRSRFIHGGRVDLQPQVFVEAAQFLDSTLRQLFRTSDNGFVHNFLFEPMSTSEFNAVFLSKLFGEEQSGQ